MWLLDANLDVHLLALLEEFGMHAEAATRRGWQTLSNGDLVAAAVAAGFTCLLTHDRLFGESAARASRQFPEFAVVLVRLPQLGAGGITAMASGSNGWSSRFDRRRGD